MSRSITKVTPPRKRKVIGNQKVTGVGRVLADLRADVGNLQQPLGASASPCESEPEFLVSIDNWIAQRTHAFDGYLHHVSRFYGADAGRRAGGNQVSWF